MKENALRQIRETYEKLVGQPFFTRFDEDAKMSAFGLFKDMQKAFFMCPELCRDYYVDDVYIRHHSNPACGLFKELTHEFNTIFFSVSEKNYTDVKAAAESCLGVVSGILEDSDEAFWTYTDREGDLVTLRAVEVFPGDWVIRTELPAHRKNARVADLVYKIEKYAERRIKAGKPNMFEVYYKALLDDITFNKENFTKFI